VNFPVNAWRVLGIATLALLSPSSPAGSGPAPMMGDRLVIDGVSAPLMTNAQRRAAGIRNGPDSIVDVWRSEPGRLQLIFSGSHLEQGRGTMVLRVGPDLKIDLAAPRATVVLQADRRSPGFDYDYAGGGDVFTCPGANGKTLYFYHGENHTDPTGRYIRGPKNGWTGIGMATWNARAGRFAKDGQIIGMAVDNTWRKDKNGRYKTLQGPPISGNPNVVPDRSGEYLYLYYTDRTDDPAYEAKGQDCDKRACTAVARAAVSQVCSAAGTGSPAPWFKYYKGAFTQPGLLGSGSKAVGKTAGSAGVGGRYTPIVDRFENRGETTPNVTWLPRQDLYVMTALRRPERDIAVRYSRDLLAWTDPEVLIGPAPKGYTNKYPRLNVIAGADGAERYMMLWTVKAEASWEDAELRGQAVRFASRR